MSRSNRIAEQLGMSYGAAGNKLRKLILFSLLEKLGENVCFKCKEVIHSVDELSIEHIQPWEGREAKLFWDLTNIAFSHLACNLPHTYHGGTSQRKIGPEGTSWCIVCQKFEPIDNFWKDSSRWNGLRQYCKESRPYR